MRLPSWGELHSTVTLLAYGLAGGATMGIIFVIAFLVTGADIGDPNLAACKAAMREDFEQGTQDSAAATVGGPGESTRPPECKGIDDETAQRLAEEVMNEALDG